jgi:hypothetical protein
MRFDYITKDDENSLVSFFSERTLSITFNVMWLMALFLLLLWPKNELFQYLEDQSYPIVFLGTFVSALLMISYLNLRWGGGEFFQTDYFYILSNERVASIEEKNNFFFYGLIGFILHVVLLIFLVFPLLIASAVISGISLLVFAKAVSVLFAASLLCRMFGFVIHLLCKNHSWLKYHLARLFFILFFGISGAFASFVNPVVMIYFLHKDGKILTHLPYNPYLLHIITVIGTIFILSIAVSFMIPGRTQDGEPS